MTPFASLSIHNFVNSVGAYVGLGSIIAVALLVLLYFAHARETASLRDRLDEAQQRIGGLEARLGQLMQAQSGAARRVPAPVTPAPSGVQSGPVRRVPSPATAAAGAAAGLAAAAATPKRKLASGTWAPAGTAAPALASATKLIPDPATAGSGAPDDTIFLPAAAVAANGQTAAARAQRVSPPTQALPVATAAAAASARTASASPRAATAVASPPRMQLATEAAGAGTAAGVAAASDGSTGSAGAGRVRRIGGNKPEAATPILPSFSDEASGGGRFSGRVLPLLIGGIAVVVIIVGLIIIINAGGGSTTGQVAHNNGNTNQTGAGLHKQQQAAQTFHAGNETVAVLNGTAQSGLAGDVGGKLTGQGFKQGNITNGNSQTQALTFVYYVPGASAKTNKVAAQHVAKALNLPPSRVRPAGSSVKQSCAVSPTGASLGSCNANVIVSVGQDRVNLASGGSSG